MSAEALFSLYIYEALEHAGFLAAAPKTHPQRLKTSAFPGYEMAGLGSKSVGAIRDGVFATQRRKTRFSPLSIDTFDC